MRDRVLLFEDDEDVQSVSFVLRARVKDREVQSFEPCK